MSPEEYKTVLGKYLPSAAVDSTYDFLEKYSVCLHITRPRHSKLGDYRWPQPHHSHHAISVNGNLNPYHFLIVLLHEMAHLNTYLVHGTAVRPHGHEWQNAYRQLLLLYLDCFTDDIATLIKKYTAHIPLSRTIEKQIDMQLLLHNPNYNPAADLKLDQLPAGTDFRIVAKPSKPFRSIERRRTRWICLGLDDNRQYLVSGNAVVKIINQ